MSTPVEFAIAYVRRFADLAERLAKQNIVVRRRLTTPEETVIDCNRVAKLGASILYEGDRRKRIR